MTTLPTDIATSASRWPHRIAMVLVVLVFPLIWLGGMVTTTDAGMAVPDWPNTYGYNMFLYPLESWLFGPIDLMVEHGHRLLASLAGLVTIVLVIASYRREPRQWVKTFSIGLLALVILQGLLGAARVLLDERMMAKIHGCVGPLFFAAVAAFCVVTSRAWNRGQRPDPNESKTGAKPDSGLQPAQVPASWMCWSAPAMLLISFGQLVIGAFLRHISVQSPPSVYVLLIAMHVVTAVLIVVGTLGQWALSRNKRLAGTKVRQSANILAVLVLVQLCLGCATWVVKFGWPAWFANENFAATYVVGEKSLTQVNLITAHVAVGSLILAFWTVHTLHCRRSVLASGPEI